MKIIVRWSPNCFTMCCCTILYCTVCFVVWWLVWSLKTAGKTWGVEVKRASTTFFKFASSKTFKPHLQKWPMAELVSVFVYVYLPLLHHCCVLYCWYIIRPTGKRIKKSSTLILTLLFLGVVMYKLRCGKQSDLPGCWVVWKLILLTSIFITWHFLFSCRCLIKAEAFPQVLGGIILKCVDFGYC